MVIKSSMMVKCVNQAIVGKAWCKHAMRKMACFIDRIFKALHRFNNYRHTVLIYAGGQFHFDCRQQLTEVIMQFTSEFVTLFFFRLHDGPGYFLLFNQMAFKPGM